MRSGKKSNMLKIWAVTATAVVLTSGTILAAIALTNVINKNEVAQAKTQEQSEEDIPAATDKVKTPTQDEGKDKQQQQLQQQQQMQEVVDTGTIYENIFISEVDVGGLTKSEAIKKLTDIFQESVDQQAIVFTWNDQQWNMPYTYLNARYNIAETVDKAYNVARKGTLEERYEAVMLLQKNPVQFELAYSVDKSMALEKLEEIGAEVSVPAKNATMVKEGDDFVVTEGENGLLIDAYATYSQVEGFIDKLESATVELLTKEVKPTYGKEAFENAKSLIGTFYTNYNVNAGDRNVNLTVAASKIDKTVMYPGDSFSTGNMFGDTSAANGYKLASVIKNGRLDTGYGGGVCQVSSTLYNAVLFSELDILERFNHSLAVSYVPLGRDATLATGSKDFRFQNSSDYPIYVEAYVKKGKVVVSIYGHENRPSNRTITFETEVNSTTPPPEEKVTYSDAYYEDERIVEVKAVTGHRVTVYKNVLIDGKLEDRSVVNKSSYLFTQGEVTVGTLKRTGEELPTIPTTGDPTEPPLFDPDPIEPTDPVNPPTQEPDPVDPTTYEPDPVEPTTQEPANPVVSLPGNTQPDPVETTDTTGLEGEIIQSDEPDMTGDLN